MPSTLFGRKILFTGPIIHRNDITIGNKYSPVPTKYIQSILKIIKNTLNFAKNRIFFHPI